MSAMPPKNAAQVVSKAGTLSGKRLLLHDIPEGGQMNRIIKFRAWIISEKCCYEVCEITPTKIGVLIQDSGPFLFPKDDCILEQFTGLYDKNGVEIYEGDVVKVYSRVSIIQYKDCAYEMIKLDGNFDGHLCFLKSNDIEKLGSAHENPELLESK
jgi:hypothetical protein